MSKWLVNRDAVEGRFGASLTEQEWASVASEIEGRIDTLIDEILDEVIQDKTGEK